MNYVDSLKLMNEQLKNWDFKKRPLKEYLELLEEKNMIIIEHTPIIDFLPERENPSKNICSLRLPVGNPENIALHVGFPHQKRLHGLEDTSIKVRYTIGVFFSLDPKDVIFFSGKFEKSDEMTYFLDTATVKDARVQTKYSSGVISRYDLDDLFEANPAESRESLRGRVQELNDKWLIDNTIPFEFTDINELKAKYFHWMIVPDPIDVLN